MTKALFIGYPSCSTCKKCYQALQDLNIDVTYRNIKTDTPTKEEIQQWIKQGVSIHQLFNTSGQSYRKANMKEKRKTYTEDQLIDVLASDGMMIKRPIVISKDTILIGNKISEYKKLK